MSNIKILDSIWFTPMGSVKPIGIVTVQVDEGDKKAYIGFGDGDDQRFDENEIVTKGAKLHKFSLVNLMKQLDV